MSPKIWIRVRKSKEAASLVTMPKTSVHENHSFVFPHNDVRFARQSLVVESVSKTSTEKVFPDNELWSRVFSTDSRHAMMPLFRSHLVSHALSCNLLT